MSDRGVRMEQNIKLFHYGLLADTAMEPILIPQCFVNRHHKVKSSQLQLKITLSVQAGLKSYYVSALPKDPLLCRMVKLAQCNLKV